MQQSERRALTLAVQKQQQVRDAMVSGQYQHAAQLLEKGFDLLEHLPKNEDWQEAMFLLLLEQAWLKRFQGESGALEDFRSVRQRSPSPYQQAEALVGIGDCYRKMGDYGKAETAYRQAIAESNPEERSTCCIRAWSGLGALYWQQGRVEESLEVLDRAHHALRHNPSVFDLGVVMLHMGVAHYYAGQLDRALAANREAFECFQTLGDDRGIAMVLCNLGEAYQELNDIQTALEVHQEGLEAARRAGAPIVEIDLVRNIGVDLMLMGRCSEGMEHLERARELASEIGDRDLFLQVLYSLGDAFLREGRVNRAMKVALELEEEANSLNSALRLARAKLLQGRIHLAQGERERATAVLQDALANAQTLPSRLLLWELHAAIGRACRDPEVACVHLQIAADFIHQTAEPVSDEALSRNFLRRPDVQAVLRNIR